MRVTKLEFINLLGDDFDTLFAASKSSIEVEKFMKMLDWATPDPDGTAIDLADSRVVGALQGFEAAGLIAEGRAVEILGTPQVPSVVVSSPAVVYKLGDNYMTCYEGEAPPEHFDNQWPISALLGEMIKSGAAEIRIIGDELEVFQRVV